MEVGSRVFPKLIVAVLCLVGVVVPTGSARADVETVEVDCAKGETIAEALEEDTPLVVVIQGTCNETVVINKNNVTLVAGAAGATVNGPDPNANTITVRGNRVLIDGLQVTGGRNGIVGVGVDLLTIRNCTVESTGRTGIVFFQGTNGTVDNCLVQDNPRDGIGIDSGAAAVVTNSEIKGNNRRGILVSNGGSARIGISARLQLAGNMITNNKSDEIGVSIGASADIGGNTISGKGWGC